MLKICSTCKQEKDISEFYKNKSSKDGYQSRCKECHKMDSSKWSEENPEYRRNWNEENPEYHRKWNEENPEYYTNYREEHTEEKAFHNRKYRKDNPEKVRAHSILNYAVATGEIKRKPCEKCGSIFNIVGHHEDYSKALDATWLCCRHHSLLHIKKLKRIHK